MASNYRRSRIRRGPALVKGMTVYDIGDPHDLGTVKEVGPEVCDVEFAGSSRRFVSNQFLRISNGNRLAKPVKRPRH